MHESLSIQQCNKIKSHCGCYICALVWLSTSNHIRIRIKISIKMKLQKNKYKQHTLTLFSTNLVHHLLFQPIPTVSQHGSISGYRVTLTPHDLDPLTSDILPSSRLSYRIDGLSPWTEYSLVIEAENPKGFSPKSDPVHVWTEPTGKIFQCMIYMIFAPVRRS